MSESDNQTNSGVPSHRQAHPHYAISVNKRTGERMQRFSESTGIPQCDLLIMSCRNEIIAGARILAARSRL